LGLFLKYFSEKKNIQNNNSLLWKIIGNHLSKPSYIFGTMHLICMGDFVWTNKMSESLENCDKICFEINKADPQLKMKRSALMIDSSGKTLIDYFSPEQYLAISKYLKDQLGVNISRLSEMKPMVLEAILIRDIVNCPNTVSYEDTIMKMGQFSNKEIIGLEEPREEFEAFERLPNDSLASHILEEINHPEITQINYQILLKTYKLQDLPSLYEQIIKTKDIKDNIGPLLYDRNAKWIGRMTDKMHKSSVFFAVGAGHLWGDKGVITLLRKNGYTVEAIK
jgi:hypothetical protein